jgi:NAD(P)H-hydrate epimerase
LYIRLLKQCSNIGIPVLSNVTTGDLTQLNIDLIIDAVFGFGFNGEVRPPFDKVLDLMKNFDVPIASIDIPSGWDVEKGDVNGNGLLPDMLISLTAPKLCANFFKGRYHFLGGRFVPPSMAQEYDLNLPKYQGYNQHVQL